MSLERNTDAMPPGWRAVVPYESLIAKGRLTLRIDGRQIVVFVSGSGIRACDNRCPHEGYPLSEGSLADDCVLTCNWHNWKFDLESGDSLYGGDKLRVYPAEVHEGQIWLDLTEPPFEAQRGQVVEGLRAAVADNAYDRIAREVARLELIGGDPLDALRLAIKWSWRRFEFGWTHAYAGMADWLALYDEYDADPEARLVCLVESVGHVADDGLRQPDFPYPEGAETYSEHSFLAAIENEDEHSAIRQIRGALEGGASFDNLEYALTRAALAHYNDFGHSLIYVCKAGELIKRLGSEVELPLLLCLVRSIIFAPREDQIPEFRGYRPALDEWGTGSSPLPTLLEWRREGINSTLAFAVSHSASASTELYRHLLFRNSGNLLRFDLDHPEKPHAAIAENVGWLDFTHGLTFANAVRKQCTKFPDLWPPGLLQMALFAGRNGRFTTESVDLRQWRPDDPGHTVATLLEQVINHAEGEYIVSVHLLKTAFAARQELLEADSQLAAELSAALSRFMGSPLRRRQPRRTAYQSLKFVAGA